MPWSTSDRRQRLPRDWPKRVAAVKRRDAGRCTGIRLGNATPWHVDECDGRGTEVDHVHRGDDHDLGNLALLSGPCHQRKTFLEKPQRKRPTEQHPGALKTRPTRGIPPQTGHP